MSNLCRDCNHKLIKIGDYVVGVKSSAYAKRIEGYVTNILEFETVEYIQISTPGNRVLVNSAYPFDYEIQNDKR